MKKLLRILMAFLFTVATFEAFFGQYALQVNGQETSSTSDPTDDLYYYLSGSAAPTWGVIDITYSEVSQINSTHIRLLTETSQPIPLTNQWQSFYWILDTGYPTSGWEALGGNPLDINDLTVAYFVAVSWSADGSLYVRYTIFWDGSGNIILIEDARDYPEKYFNDNTCFITIPLNWIGNPNSIKWVAGSSDGVGGPSGRHDKAPNTGHVTLSVYYPVGGIWVPINKFELVAPWITLFSLIIVATASIVYAKHKKMHACRIQRDLTQK